MFLVNSRFPQFSATSSSSGREVRHPDEVPLLPKLRGHFAEFLNHSSPDRLGILYPPTCVGLGYGQRVSSLGTFLGSMDSVTSLKRSGSRLRVCESRICLGLPLHASPRTTNAWAHLSSCVLPLLPASGSDGSTRRSAPNFPWIGMGADTLVLEYQPVVHRLRLSASP